MPIPSRDGDRNLLRKRARPAGDNNTCGPLTTTNSTTELTMADANHSAPVIFNDFFVTSQASLQSRRIVPHLRLTDMAPPVLHLWMKLSGRWIEAAGFEPEQRLQIEVTHKRLVITPLGEAGSDPAGKDGCLELDPAAGQQQRRFSVITGGAQ
jgi:toxic protein SymE